MSTPNAEYVRHAWRPGAIKQGRKVVGRLICVVCCVPAECAHDRTPLRLVGPEEWVCPTCGDEWSEDSFGPCQGAQIDSSGTSEKPDDA